MGPKGCLQIMAIKPAQMNCKWSSIKNCYQNTGYIDTNIHVRREFLTLLCGFVEYKNWVYQIANRTKQFNSDLPEHQTRIRPRLLYLFKTSVFIPEKTTPNWKVQAPNYAQAVVNTINHLTSKSRFFFQREAECSQKAVMLKKYKVGTTEMIFYAW